MSIEMKNRWSAVLKKRFNELKIITLCGWRKYKSKKDLSIKIAQAID